MLAKTRESDLYDSIILLRAVNPSLQCFLLMKVKNTKKALIHSQRISPLSKNHTAESVMHYCSDQCFFPVICTLFFYYGRKLFSRVCSFVRSLARLYVTLGTRNRRMIVNAK